MASTHDIWRQPRTTRFPEFGLVSDIVRVLI
jgi:hypothetical protein